MGAERKPQPDFLSRFVGFKTSMWRSFVPAREVSDNSSMITPLRYLAR
jgi:hypothetical protein